MKGSVDGMHVVLSSQTYGPVNPITSKHLRVAVMHAANRGVVWVADGSADRLGYGHARNTSVQFTFDNAPEAEGIMWVDSDIKPEADRITRLLSTARQYDYDFVSGIYFQRDGVHNPVFYDWNLDKKCFQPAEVYPKDTIGPIAGCGFGFVYTSMKMLRDIALTERFDIASGWFPDKRDLKGGFGEDLSFCQMAREAGYQLYVNTGIQVAHEANPQYITEEDFEKEKEAWHKSNKESPKLPEWGPTT
jgi:hypothetical protein